MTAPTTSKTAGRDDGPQAAELKALKAEVAALKGTGTPPAA